MDQTNRCVKAAFIYRLLHACEQDFILRRVCRNACELFCRFVQPPFTLKNGRLTGKGLLIVGRNLKRPIERGLGVVKAPQVVEEVRADLDKNVKVARIEFGGLFIMRFGLFPKSKPSFHEAHVF